MPDAVAPSTLEALRNAISGHVFAPEDSGYEKARMVLEGTVDRRPVIIAQCLNTADIADAIAFAKENGLEVSVRGGGRSIAGLSVCDGGFMIDLSAMKGVHVDQRSQRARAQGASCGESTSAPLTPTAWLPPGGPFRPSAGPDRRSPPLARSWPMPST